MVSVHFGVTSRAFNYSHTVGRMTFFGEGFRHPMDIAVGKDGRIYVPNRSRQDRPNGVRVTVCTVGEEFLYQFSAFGAEDGQLTWPVSIALDSMENIYVADQWLNRISIFSNGGDFLGKWGTAGSGDGELDQPFGMRFDSDDHLFIVDSRNGRIQKFTKDGRFLAKFGEPGSGPGQFDLPWGIDFDQEGYLYVADWNNHRVQKLTPEGEYVAELGTHGSGAGEFHRPSGVAVDAEGDIYVADWGNHRLQVFTSDGRHISTFTGDATLSKWGELSLEANPDKAWQRNLVRDFEPERRFWNPVAVAVDPQNRVLVADCMRHRLQVYQKIYASR